ncbi:hypothetical protein BV22DRAFT_1130744 [Leucogyrophana mollusca]|uniref:Uncharacterized protein n=1 Tax=Leucogyrophana mollusca TaxID=85980 RepID=A0ACB8BBY0_9AGAM|nr:hypothetical protein BV22DRAFT_1130744 [Leucogyrophana mollusca]
MSAEYAPYYNGMQRGQGFNTFTQATCLAGAVTVSSTESGPTPFQREYYSELIEDYEKLAKSLDISAGATISGWDQSGQIDVQYLNRSDFERSDVTYQVKVNVQHQATHTGEYSFNWVETPNPHQTYGDHFVQGGFFYARISIRSINRSDVTEIKQAAKLAFSMYGAQGTVTNEVKSAVEKINKHSETHIVIKESGGGTTNETSPAEGSNDLLMIKAKADKFYEDAANHKYMRFAILARYENVKNFSNAFRPFDYVYANKRSWELFDEFTRYTAMETFVKKIPDTKYLQGSSQKAQFENQRVKEMKEIREKVLAVRDDPSKADSQLTCTPSHQFRANVLAALKTVKYIAQSIPLEGGENWTDAILPSLMPTATKLFDLICYDFSDIEGSTVVSFGSTQTGKDYIALIDNRASGIPGWKEDSHFWVFEDIIPNVAELVIVVSRLSSKNYVRVTTGSPWQGSKELFRFHGFDKA